MSTLSIKLNPRDTILIAKEVAMERLAVSKSKVYEYKKPSRPISPSAWKEVQSRAKLRRKRKGR